MHKNQSQLIFLNFRGRGGGCKQNYPNTYAHVSPKERYRTGPSRTRTRTSAEEEVDGTYRDVTKNRGNILQDRWS